MTASEIYGVIWKEMQRLLQTGAVNRRGRPRNDSENELFHRQTRAYKLALKNLPSDLKADWARQPKLLAHLPKLQDSIYAQDRARTRARNRLQMGLAPTEPALLRQATRRSTERTDRLQAVNSAIDVVQTSNRRVTSKTVASAMKNLYGDKYDVATETIRRDIAKIRRDRPK